MKANRLQVAIETLDGGMITFSTTKLCDLYENIWGDTDEGLTAPEGWTPFLMWLDNRRSNLVEEGIWYVSETEAALRKYERWPYALVRYDDVVPLKCEDGYLVADFDNLGLAYVYGEASGCMSSEVNQGFIWQGYGLVGNWEGRYGRLFFDFRTKSLWVLR